MYAPFNVPDLLGRPLEVSLTKDSGLAGLVFVSISINLQKILSFKSLPSRAIEALGVLLAVLAMSSLLLVPDQSAAAVGLEVLAVGLAAWIMVITVAIKSIADLKPEWAGSFALRIVIGQIATLPAVVVGIMILVRGEVSDASLYWIVPAFLASTSYATGGTIYGLQLGRRGGVPGNDDGQGTETGFGTWTQICTGAACNNVDLRAQAATLKLTGYYRPEDEDIDRAQLAQGNVRFCGTNTGNENEDQNYGEVICFTDGTVSAATANTGVPEVHRFVEGSPAFAMPDNVAYQQSRGNWVFHEDAETTYLTPHDNDLWDCLGDGND